MILVCSVLQRGFVLRVFRKTFDCKSKDKSSLLSHYPPLYHRSSLLDTFSLSFRTLQRCVLVLSKEYSAVQYFQPKLTTHATMFVLVTAINKLHFTYPMESQIANAGMLILWEWKRGNFYLFSKGHLSHLRKDVHITFLNLYYLNLLEVPFHFPNIPPNSLPFSSHRSHFMSGRRLQFAHAEEYYRVAISPCGGPH